jgi:hypothetical protein
MLDRGMDVNELGKAGALGLWTRKVYRAGFADGSITAVIRTGDRTKNKDAHGWLPHGVDMAIRFIDTQGYAPPGANQYDPRWVNPVFIPDDGTTVRITRHIVKKICELTDEDLAGCSPDCSTPELVRYHLGLVYNTELPGLDQVVTIWRFEHRPRATE